METKIAATVNGSGRTPSIKLIAAILLISILFAGCGHSNYKAGTPQKVVAINPLPSWEDGLNKSAIIQFVNEVTREGGDNYVPPEKRIATFDQDGTLWCEKPDVQMEFIIWLVKKLAPDHPEWKTQDPYQAILKGDKDALMKILAGGQDNEWLELIFGPPNGMPIQNYDDDVREFLTVSRHPRYGKPYTETIYQPMLELLEYLRENGFKTYICSGGGNDFMRVITERTYGIVPENVIGTFAMNSFEQVNGAWEIVKAETNGYMNDGPTKPSCIQLHIGRIPIFSAGNVRTGGDIEHLTYCQTNTLPNFQLLINHDDAVREYAYKEKNGASLRAAEENRWHVVSMKNDWLKIFAYQK